MDTNSTTPSQPTPSATPATGPSAPRPSGPMRSGPRPGGPRFGSGGPRSGPGGRPGFSGPRGAGGPGGRGRRPMPRRKVCRFCQEKVEEIDYKATPILRAFMTPRGKILSGRSTGTCAKHQRQLTSAIMRSRNLALLPFTGE